MTEQEQNPNVVEENPDHPNRDEPRPQVEDGSGQPAVRRGEAEGEIEADRYAEGFDQSQHPEDDPDANDDRI